MILSSFPANCYKSLLSVMVNKDEYIYIYYEIVLKVHNKKKMEKDKEKIKTHLKLH